MAIGKHCTTVSTVEIHGRKYTNVTYHQTAVVIVGERGTILNSGGYRTRTTKVRMNQASDQFGLGFHVYQKGGEWFVDHNNKTIPFEDGMVLTR